MAVLPHDAPMIFESEIRKASDSHYTWVG
jgi:hypothetical protein